MRGPEFKLGPSSLEDRDAALAPARGEDFCRAGAHAIASLHEPIVAANVASIIGGRIILPLIDSTTMAANSRAASRLNSTS
jgi:hypothetical protein